MEAKDYTNIAGTPFQPFVRKQIEARKALVSKENRDTSDLLWLNNKSAWIRVSSGTDVDDENPYFTEVGDTLSRKYILQAGLTDHSKVINQADNIFKLREGLGDNGAYGIGGTKDFGFRPMPGLTGLSIKTGGKLGTLREATIEFTCYNLEQLNIMDALYMKLGFSVLIEWGHIPYINNNGVLQKTPIPMDFYGKTSKEELMEEIQKKRVYHAGNYDAMWGTVKNFTYSFEGNGEFKCKVDLVGAGDILESLKINQSGNLSIQIDETSPYPVVADANKSLLNEALYNYFNTVKDNSTQYATLQNNSDFATFLKLYFKTLKINFNDFILDNSDLITKGFHYSLLSKLNENNGDTKVNIPDILYPTLYFSGYKLNISTTSENEENQQNETQVYITLGHLLLLTLATGGLFDKTKNDPEAPKKPYIYIDVNSETNRCYTFPGHCSLDPTICLIGSEKLPYNIESNLFKDEIQPNYPFYDSSDPDLGGRFMWTLVNIDFIVKTLRKYSSSDPKDGGVIFVDFIQDILTSISKACGGFNEFRIVPDDDTRCVRIFDDRVIPTFKYETEKYLKIPVLGKDSLAYNFNYTTRLSPQTAAQIVISAQAQDKGVQGDKNPLAFSHLSTGLTNRLSPSRGDAVENLNESPNESKLPKYIELRDHIVNLYDGTIQQGLINEENYKQIQQDNKVENLESGLKTIPEGNFKNVLTATLEKIYGDLGAAANGLREEGNELRNLTIAYNNVKAKIESETNFDSAYLYKSEDGKNIVYNDSSINNYIHDLLESEYKSVRTISDTPIEAAWTKLAIKQTGVSRSWY
jgi:hypothetical protein